jgi:hypothetical protein
MLIRLTQQTLNRFTLTTFYSTLSTYQKSKGDLQMGVHEKAAVTHIETSCFLTAVYTYLHAKHPNGFTNADFKAAYAEVLKTHALIQEKLFANLPK